MAPGRPTEKRRDDDDTITRTDAARDVPVDIGIPGYQIVRELHTGGQGVVYVAVQQSTHRKVAIKLLHRRHDHSEQTRKRFEREIELVAQFNHPNIIKVFDCGVTDDKRMFCVMEYVRGKHLTAHIREQNMTLEGALALFVRLCEAVGHAHQRGIVHRDLKPANILVDSEGGVRVLDFGLAKAVGPALDNVLSQTGQFVGTLRYTSPEQLRAAPEGVDVRADVYALGVILYEILTGTSPYPEPQQVADWARNVLESDPTPPSKAWDSRFGILSGSSAHEASSHCPIDTDLQTIVLTALAKVRDRRYSDAAAMGQDIDRYLRGEPIAARRDSMAYWLQNRFRRSVARHQVTTWCAVIALSVLIAQFLVAPLVFKRTDINDWFEGEMAHAYPPAFGEQTFESVCVIGFNEETDFEALAAREDVHGVDRNVPRSWRRMHGRLMQKLAATGSKTVVFDITFTTESEYDDLFVDGAKALRAAGIDAVVAVPTWWFDAPGLPLLSPKILPHVRYGSPIIRLKDTPYTAQLVAQRGLADPQWSLTLAAYAAFRRPRSNCEIRIDRDREAIDLAYWTPNATSPTEKNWELPADRLPLTRYQLGTVARGPFKDAFDRRWGLVESDLLGFMHFDIPSDAFLAASTIPYERVFRSAPDELANLMKGKVIMVGDLRRGSDTHPLSDGRMVAACYGHAAAIDLLINGEIVRMMRPRAEITLLLLCAAFGSTVAAVGAVRRRMIRIAVVLGGMLLIVVFSVYAYSQWYYLFNPIVPAVSLLIAFLLCTWSTRVRRSHGAI